jgi:hypothetical protein
MPKGNQTTDVENLRQRLKLKALQSETKLLSSHPAAKKFFLGVGLRPGQIRTHAAKLLASGTLAGSLLLSVPAIPILTVSPPVVVTQPISSLLPSQIGPLTFDQENILSKRIKQDYGLNAYATLEGNKLLQSYGRMGAEQHLPRYPGDTAAAHGNLIEKGITPGLGGWGYVGNPEVEKYYVAVQTLYLPDWKTRTKYLANWYKHRRMLVINPANGKAIVTAVADAGPSWWTGKHFGGSPEVMQYLEINYGRQNHPVIMFFLDDPNKQVPLGPVQYNQNNQFNKS